MKSYDNIKVKADRDEVYAINNKDIVAPDDYTDIVVKGDDKSNSLIFKINRYVDGIDIFGKTFQIFYINAEGYAGIAAASEVFETDDYILFTWLPDSTVTKSAGEVQYIVKISGIDYVWKSKPSKLEVVETLGD